MKHMKIAVVGLGVVGGSIAKALKDRPYEVYGIDIDEATLALAKQEGCIRQGYTEANDIVPLCDLTIICLYPSLILEFLKHTKFKPGSIVSDVVGIKSYFLEKALKILPDDVEYISVHPMAGRENRGYAYASAEVFQNANFIIIQHTLNQEKNIRFMQDFAAGLGFKSVKIMSPYDHDEIISYTSQLPHTMAVALVNSDTGKYETGKYIGDSYRDLTRIAKINEELWSELFLNNKEYLLTSIKNFEEQLDLIKNAILEDDVATLKELFRQATALRDQLEK